MSNRSLVVAPGSELATTRCMAGLAKRGLVGGALMPFAELMAKYRCSAETIEVLIARGVPLKAIEAGLRLALSCEHGTQLDIVEILHSFGDIGWRSGLGALDGSDGASRATVMGFIPEVISRVRCREKSLAVLEYIESRCGGNGWDLLRLYQDDESDAVFAIQYWYKLMYQSGHDFAA